MRWPLPGVVAGGIALAAAFPKPDLHLFVWVAMVPLLLVASRTDPWGALRYGFLFGMVFRAGNLYWVVHAMTRHGGLPVPLAMLGAGLLMAYLAAYWGLFALVVQRVGLRSRAAPFLLAACWAGLEYFQSWFLTGFPWTFIGYAAGRSAILIQFASVAGVFGLTFLAVLVNAAVAGWLRHGNRVRGTALASAALALVALAYGGWSLETATASEDRLTVGLVQGNVPQDLKWDVSARREILDRHVELSRQAAAQGAQLVLWPESSWPDPYGIERDATAYDQVSRVAVEHATAIVVGTVRVTAADDGYDVANAAVLLGRDGGVDGAYEKSHLVPFGEYLPYPNILGLIGLRQLVNQGGFTPGPGPQVLEVPGLPPFSPLICYEMIFPSEVVPESQRPGWLLQVTNDGWFGAFGGPQQHLAQARIRAIEQGLPVVRVANTGISAAIRPDGRILTQIPLNTAGFRDIRLPAALPPTVYARYGDVPAMSLVLLCLFLCTRRRGLRSTG